MTTGLTLPTATETTFPQNPIEIKTLSKTALATILTSSSDATIANKTLLWTIPTLCLPDNEENRRQASLTYDAETHTLHFNTDEPLEITSIDGLATILEAVQDHKLIEKIHLHTCTLSNLVDVDYELIFGTFSPKKIEIVTDADAPKDDTRTPVFTAPIHIERSNLANRVWRKEAAPQELFNEMLDNRGQVEKEGIFSRFLLRNGFNFTAVVVGPSRKNYLLYELQLVIDPTLKEFGILDAYVESFTDMIKSHIKENWKCDYDKIFNYDNFEIWWEALQASGEWSKPEVLQAILRALGERDKIQYILNIYDFDDYSKEKPLAWIDNRLCAGTQLTSEKLSAFTEKKNLFLYCSPGKTPDRKEYRGLNLSKSEKAKSVSVSLKRKAFANSIVDCKEQTSPSEPLKTPDLDPKIVKHLESKNMRVFTIFPGQLNLFAAFLQSVLGLSVNKPLEKEAKELFDRLFKHIRQNTTAYAPLIESMLMKQTDSEKDCNLLLQALVNMTSEMYLKNNSPTNQVLHVYDAKDFNEANDSFSKEHVFKSHPFDESRPNIESFMLRYKIDEEYAFHGLQFRNSKKIKANEASEEDNEGAIRAYVEQAKDNINNLLNNPGLTDSEKNEFLTALQERLRNTDWMDGDVA